jgi:hypothetical protein
MKNYLYLLMLLIPVCCTGCLYRFSSKNIGKITVLHKQQPIVFDVIVKDRATSWILVWEENRLNEAERRLLSIGKIDMYIKNLSDFKVRAFTNRLDLEGRKLFYDISLGEEALLYTGSVTNLIKSSYGISFNGIGRVHSKLGRRKILAKIILTPKSSIELGKGKIKLTLENSDSI